MENPFELILERLAVIENLLRTSTKNDNLADKEKNTEIFNIYQAAEYVSLSKATIYSKTASREIPHFKKGKRLYFKKSELEVWMTGQRILTLSEIENQADEYLLRKGRAKVKGKF